MTQSCWNAERDREIETEEWGWMGRGLPDESSDW